MGLKQVFVSGGALALGGPFEMECGQGGVVAALAGVEGGDTIADREIWCSGARSAACLM
jgi:hypothetical protein